MGYPLGAKVLTKCRICKLKTLTPFLNLGLTPLPNAFLKKQSFKKEKKYPLEVVFCSNCSLVQLNSVVSPKLMFSDYLYIPSTSKVMLNNFNNLSLYALKKLKLKKNSKVLDIGSNDGTLLKFFKNQNMIVYGVDPAKNLAAEATNKGIPTIPTLFNANSASKITQKYGQFDLITATNVIAHINNLDEVLEGVSLLLKDNGTFITEFPYLLDLISKNQFDTIYHEHLSYFSLMAWVKLLESHDLKIVDLERLQIHGGSIRLVHKKFRVQGSGFRVNKTVKYLINLEKTAGLDNIMTYLEFAKSIQNLKSGLKTLLKDLKTQGKRIIGLGAAAKGNILLNYFDINTKTLDYIADSTPQKLGLYTPGTHIPVLSEDEVFKNPPDYALILAWNFKEEIIRKYSKLHKKGMKFIIPIPGIKIV